MKKSHATITDDQLEMKWNSIKNTFLQEYSCLTPHDLHYEAEGFDKLLQHIGQKTGITTSKLKRIIMRWDDAWLHFF